MGCFEPKWKSIRADLVNALDIKGYHRRAYYYDNFFQPYRRWVDVYHRFALVVYYNEHDQMCEIRDMGSSNASSPICKTINPDKVRPLYDHLMEAIGITEEIGHGWGWRNSKFEVRDGRAFIHGISNRFFGEPLLNNLYYFIGGVLVENCGQRLTVSMHWDLPTYNDIQDVSLALSGLYYSVTEIMDNYHLKRKNALKLDIANKTERIEELRNRLNSICEDSAEAMNILSEKYGIELSI